MNAALSPGIPARLQPQPNCERTSVGLVPLPDLGSATYQGFPGGLYPDGANQPPANYLQEGAASAQRVQPRDATGRLDANGAVVLLSFGMSNTTMEYRAFQRLAGMDPRVHRQLTLVDGAVGGVDAARMQQPESPYWTTVARARGVERDWYVPEVCRDRVRRRHDRPRPRRQGPDAPARRRRLHVLIMV